MTVRQLVDYGYHGFRLKWLSWISKFTVFYMVGYHGFQNSRYSIWLRYYIWYGMISISQTMIFCCLTSIHYEGLQMFHIHLFIWEKLFLLVVCICIQMQITYMHTSRGSFFYFLETCYNSVLREVLLQFLLLSSNTEKGEIERTFLNPCILCVS